MKKRFNNRYISGDLPWDIKRPDKNLVEVVSKFGINPGKALDVGCGTGDNVFWLASQGFETTGTDIAPEAIKMAKDKALKVDKNVDFIVADFLKDQIRGAPFGFVFDRGCFHSFRKKRERKKYAKQVHKHLSKNGFWLSLVGSYDDGRLDVGPPKRTAMDIVSATEKYFEIISLTRSRFDSNDKIPSVIWVCLMKRRNS
jgi:SAM-dependent methyltransferase